MALESLWIYVAVPTALIVVLVLIRIRQEKTSSRVGETSSTETRKKEIRTSRKRAAEQNPSQPGEAKPNDCPKFLGYLYLQKAEDGNHILNECYNCPKLLQCLYTPNVMERVYG